MGLLPCCISTKFTGRDGKQRMIDALPQEGVDLLVQVLPRKNADSFTEWMRGGLDPIDEQSRRRAYELFGSPILSDFEVGTVRGLQQIHSYLFGGLYDFAGSIRSLNISKGGFAFANARLLGEILPTIERMPDDCFDEIIVKYVEMNIAHPFMEGNGRAMRLWLDLMLKRALGACVDWSRIGKNEYLEAMFNSPLDDSPIKALIRDALTEETDDRELFLKGIDYSYYYESAED